VKVCISRTPNAVHGRPSALFVSLRANRALAVEAPQRNENRLRRNQRTCATGAPQTATTSEAKFCFSGTPNTVHGRPIALFASLRANRALAVEAPQRSEDLLRRNQPTGAAGAPPTAKTSEVKVCFSGTPNAVHGARKF